MLSGLFNSSVTLSMSSLIQRLLCGIALVPCQYVFVERVKVTLKEGTVFGAKSILVPKKHHLKLGMKWFSLDLS